MSECVFIAHSDVTSMLETLSGRMDVWVPLRVDKGCGAVEFERFKPGCSPVLDRLSTASPKKVLFPQTETLLTYRYQKDEDDPSRQSLEIEDLQPVRPALVFGLRPCDVRGFLTFDQVFLNGPYKDPYYAARRETTVFATIACQIADSACFCSSVGSGPGDRQNSDLWMIPIDEGFVVEALTDKGSALLTDMGTPADPKQIEQAQSVQKTIEAMTVGDADLTHAARAFTDRFTDMDFWGEHLSHCNSCGMCTFNCPTCYCFNIPDEADGLEGERIRTWDSCMFNHYTREASGHNPRPTKFERFRNRVGHKFSYFPEKYDGMLACCGCGRCIRNCPVSMDIRQIVKDLKEEADA